MAENEPPVLEEGQLNGADRDILDALHEGRATPGYLSELTGHEQTYINQRLRRLEEHEHVRNLARGLWEVTDDPRFEHPVPSNEELAGLVEDVSRAFIDQDEERLKQAIERAEEAAERIREAIDR